MNIGYLRFQNDNIRTRTLNAVAHKFHGLNLIVFGPKDIDMETDTVHGKSLTSNGWKETVVPLPDIINNMTFKNTSNSELYHYLNNKSLLLFHSFGSKDRIESLLKENDLLKDLIIPSYILDKPSDVFATFNNHDKLIFKPVDGMMGKGIFTIEKKAQLYEYKEQNNYKIVNESQIVELLYNLKSKYIVQKYINSITPKGLPFDIRVHYEKNGKGKWEIAQTYTRVGISDDIVSNVAKGGSVIRARSFLRTNYGDDKGQGLFKKLEEKLKGFPRKFEALFDFNVSTLAIDLGLHEDEFYLFEVNSFPGGTFARGEVALLRSAHAKYLAQKLPSMGKEIVTYEELIKENRALKKQNKKVIEENKIQNEKLKKILHSKSWRYTSLFRRKS